MSRADSTPTATLLDELVRTLHEESDALVAGDTERLTTVAARKNDVLACLAPQLARAPESQRRYQDKVMRIAQRMNERNAHILAVRLSMNRARTESLLNAAGGSLYTANGEVSGARADAAAYARATV